jgi:hypothetical protein
MKNISSCRLCHSTSIEALWQLRECPYGDLFKNSQSKATEVPSHPIALARCSDCGLIQLEEITDIKGQYDNYIYQTKVTKGLNEFYQNIAKRVTAENFPTGHVPSFVLDIGSNDGSFLEIFKEYGLKVLGVEPSLEASRQANKNGIPTIRKYFDLDSVDEIIKLHGTPGLISINYTLANVPDIKDFMENVVKLMNEASILSIVTGYHPDQFAVNMFDYIGHDHLTYLSLTDFSNIADAHGLTILDANRYEHKGGSLHVTLIKKNPNLELSPTPNVIQLLQREQWLGVGHPWYYSKLAERIDEAQAELVGYLRENAIDKIPGIGASISTTYLMNQFQISEYISILFDDDNLKHGKFSPLFAKKVLPLSSIVDASEKVVMILAWQHTSRILKRLQDLGFKGKVIVPLPRLTVIEI